MHRIIFFTENLKKVLGFTSKFRYGRVTLNTGIFSIWPFTNQVASSDNLASSLDPGPDLARGYKSFFMLNSTEYEISTAHIH